MYQNLTLFALLCSFMQANILFQRQTHNPNFVNGFTYADIQSQSGIIATLSLNQSTNLIISYKTPNFTQKQKILSSSPDEIFKIRLPPQNSSSDFNESLLLFSQTSLTNFYSFSNLNEEILNFSIINNSYYIVDLCYGNHRKEIIVIGFFYNTSTYGFIFFNDSSTPTFMKILNISSISFLNKIVYLNSRIYAHFSDKIMIYLLDSNFTEDACISYPPFPQIQFLHFQVGLQVFIYAYGTQVIVRNSTSYQLLAEYSHDSFISGACAEGTYVIFVDDDQIIQYDYEINSIISRIMLPTMEIFTLMYLSPSSLLVFYQPTYMSSSSIFFYNFTSYYDSNTSNCLPTYLFQLTQLICIKSSSSSSNPSLNSSVSSNYSNMSDINNQSNVLMNLTWMNNTFNMNQDDQQYNIDILIRQYFQYLNKQYGLGLTYGTSSLLIFSSIKISPQFLYSLIIIFNDLWFYRFHNKSYPHSIQIIFQNVDIIETQRMNVWFLELIEALNKTTSIGLENNNKMQKYLKIKTIQQQNVFFIRSIVQNYRNSFLLPLMVYFLLKILKKIIYPIKRKARCIFLFFNFIRVNSKLWLSISSIIENIIPNLGFDIGVQMLLPSFFDNSDKLNFCVCMFVFFIVIVYSFCFYPLVFYFCLKKTRKQLMRSCRNNRNSFFFQPALFVFRVLLRSFIHSYFIQSYLQQIFFLIIVDCFSIFTSIYIRKYYKSILVFTLYTLYLIFLTIFDVYFYFESLYKFPKYLRRELFGVTILGALFTISALACLTFLFKYLLNLFKDCKKLVCRNKITKTSARTQKTRPKLSISITAKNVCSDDKSEQGSPKNIQNVSKMILCKITTKSGYKKDAPQIRLSNKTLKSLKDKESLMKNMMQVKISDHVKEQMDPDFAQLPEIRLRTTNSN